jgi:hypothetical protein
LLFIEPNAAKAGAGRITLADTGLEALLERLRCPAIEHEPIETYSDDASVPADRGDALAVVGRGGSHRRTDLQPSHAAQRTQTAAVLDRRRHGPERQDRRARLFADPELLRLLDLTILDD